MDDAIAALSSFLGGRAKAKVPSRYKPLQAADSIRLVCLSAEEGRIEGTLNEVRLSDNPEYRALSYVWSAAYDGANGKTPHATRAFVLDGHEIQITANLADFFEAIARQTPPIPVLWIDAVCINQTDEEEKSVQVRMMRRIYEQAAGILIWLGKHDATSRGCIEKIEWCQEILYQLQKSQGIKSDAPVKVNDVWMREVGLVTEDGAVKNREEWDNLGRFFVTRKWWHRMWTVQEYVPEVEKLFMCGDLFFTPNWIQNTLRLTAVIDRGPGFEFLQTAGFVIPTRIENFQKIFHDGSRPPLTVYDVLTRCRHRSATDPRDKVFAPLGLLSLDSTSDPGLKIDYSLSDETVFTNVAEYLLRTMRGLDWLEAVASSREHKYASWVPDRGRSGALAVQPLPKAAKDATGDHKVYNPWGGDGVNGEAPQIVRHGRVSQLHVTGALLDDITCLYDTNKRQDLAVVRSWIARACKELGDAPYPHTGETILCAVLRTITFDVAAIDIDTFSRQPDNLDDLINLPVDDLLVKLMRAHPSMNEEAVILREMRREMTRWRRFAVTRHGFIGLVPLHSRVGDKVFAFSGGSVLYVARELAGVFQTRYTYVGESYFHGLMDGEWREKDAFRGPSRVVLV